MNFFKKKHTTKAIWLPLFATARYPHGSTPSALILLSSIAIFVSPGITLATTNSTRQIDQAVEQHLAKTLAAEALRRGWQGLRFTYKNAQLQEAAPPGPCQQPLQLRAIDDSPTPLKRQRLEAHCPEEPGWSVTVVAQMNVFVQAVFAKQTLERGEAISQEKLELKELNLSKKSQFFFSRVDEVIGLNAKRRVRANQALTPSLLASAWLAHRGQRVTIAASQDGIQAATQGEALEDGRRGQVIKVKNISSGKIIETKVIEAGVVNSTLD